MILLLWANSLTAEAYAIEFKDSSLEELFKERNNLLKEIKEVEDEWDGSIDKYKELICCPLIWCIILTII